MIKEEMLNLLNGSPSDFFKLLLEMRGTSPLNEKLVSLLMELRQGEPYSDNAQKLLHIFFSLSSDGNTRISLISDTLFLKWKTKWDGLVVLASNGADNVQEFLSAEDFKGVIEAGCKDLIQNVERPLVVEYQKDKDGNPAPFLYTEKYLQSKNIIEKCFRKGTADCVFNGAAGKSVDGKIGETIEAMVAPSDPVFKLKEAQLESIVKGQKQNLIITGGPGTGKTTVVFFLLWNLLDKNKQMREWNIHFAAPSGKAADRLRESIEENVAMLTPVAQKDPVVEHLKNIDSYTTLHRLLSYNPQTNSFRYSSKNRFPEKSIFVIDEASMIDLSLFASFMQALPQKDYRLYVLGDKDQLPSVDAGAVLGEILDLDKGSVVELTESNRFDKNSNVGRLSQFIQKKLHEDELQFDLTWTQWNGKKALWTGKIDEVNFIQFGDGKKALPKADEEKEIQEFLDCWTEKFYRQTDRDLCSVAKKIRPNLTDKNYKEQGFSQKDWKVECSNRETLWNLSDKARVLSAERRGLRGVDSLNRMVVKSLGFNEYAPFDGKLMILTKNQSYFDLYNGDSGILVNCETRPMLMLKRKGGFVFYPLSMLPSDCIESAFAITIHKSQGSGYPNILMFLPTRKGHPLLNRQILYTGVTRTKKQSLTIVATPDTFKAACETIIERDTGIEL
ncbi:AAA family ATPase [Fibrobacter sp.]|uniref:ATP-dependent DNA helicase n=1 Tax=Fibrobacter sp. TaxID=35828 RepID=UPI0025B9E607|nr:AAA family ATPase [Fibrobacter sp.]MBR3071322.1 AAA family ATPase [Fibrobacter sp.]